MKFRSVHLSPTILEIEEGEEYRLVGVWDTDDVQSITVEKLLNRGEYQKDIYGQWCLFAICVNDNGRHERVCFVLDGFEEIVQQAELSICTYH